MSDKCAKFISFSNTIKINLNYHTFVLMATFMTTYRCKLHSQATDLTITFLIQNYAREAK